MTIQSFMKQNYRHFNAAVCVDAADAWIDLLAQKGKMVVTLAGAMSTAELGISLAEMIREGKVHAIACTGANLEEDIFNLVANPHYERVPHYRSLSAQDEKDLLDRGMNRVTDTCIPEDKAMHYIENAIIELWKKADQAHQSYFPYEFIYQLLDLPQIQKSYAIDPKYCWVLAAKEKNIPIFTPGWADSTLGNIFVGHVIKNNLKSFHTIKSDLEQMAYLVEWYKKESAHSPVGFFQIGGGIAGDFTICVVPLIRVNLKIKVPLWSYFCQISDSTTSYGSYSGAVPNEKITWSKLGVDTPRFLIESDATIVAPLIFNYVLGH
jgi:deoxyhypusine synthase